MTVPLKCMNETPDGGTFDSGVNDCKALETAFFSKDGGAPTSTCVDNGQGVCECTGTSTQPIPTSTSTYTISGNSITSTDSKGKVTTQDYCVDGLKATSLQTGVPATEATLFVLTKK